MRPFSNTAAARVTNATRGTLRLTGRALKWDFTVEVQQMSFAASYRENTPVKVAMGALGLLALAVALTYIAQIFAIGSPASLLDRLLRWVGLVPQTIGTAIVWVLAFMGLLVLALAVVLLRETEPAVRLDAAGVHDLRWSSQPVGWLNIAEFDVVRRYGVEMVQLRLKDAALDPPRTLLGRAARKTGVVAPGLLLIPVPGLDCSAEALCAKILEIGTDAVHAAEDAAEQASAAAGGAAMQNN
jgi:hypothetical protein